LDNLKLLIKLLKRYNISFRVLGAGSNILVGDSRLKGAVIRLSSPYFKRLALRNNFVDAGAGVGLGKLIVSAASKGLSGVESLSGIPGTVAGALIMNAGRSFKFGGLGDLAENVTVISQDGKIKVLKKKDLVFGYRKSNLGKYIILSACFKLFRSNKSAIKDRIKEYLYHRKESQDYQWPSAGCVFKNPKKYPAGKLIDLCNLKGKKSGGAYISKKHANFIVNQANAKACDVLCLMELAKKEVRHKFGITLKPEIILWQ
jgi:UDP-N-acetylmuramate dehydrogenase